MYCAGGKNNVSACNGDSGGGMFFNINGTWILRGIVSFSPSRPNVNVSLCDSSKPTVFTDVSKYYNWIGRYTNTIEWLKDLKPCSDSMIDNNTECNAVSQFDHDFFIVGLTNSIHRVAMNGNLISSVREETNKNELGGLDFDCVESRFYWSEPATRTIFSAKYDGTDKKVFITKDLEEPTHVAVDWISRRLYWVDYGKEAIEVASLDNPDVRTMVNINVDDPNEIAIDPVLGKLYRIHGSFGIEWSNLDGSESELLLNAKGISSIKASMLTGELCYIDQGTFKIECIDTRTKRTHSFIRNPSSPYTLAVADELVFWTQDNRKYPRNTVFCASGSNDSNACVGGSGGGMFFNVAGTWYLRGIESFNPGRLSMSNSVCDSTKPSVYTDMSKYHKWVMRFANAARWLKGLEPCILEKINKDTMCNAANNFSHGFLIVQLTNTIIRVSMNGDPINNVREDTNESELGAVDYDCAEGRFYWTDLSSKEIFSAKYDGTDEKPFITNDLDEPTHVAVDWISRRLYWVDTEKETIEAASLDDPSMRTVVIANVDNVNEIAVDPLQGKLYRLRNKKHIECSNLDGSQSETLLSTTGISTIKVSLATGELCYVNSATFEIECIETLSKKTRTIMRNPSSPDALSVTEDMFYWTGHKSPCNINNGDCGQGTMCFLNPRAQAGKACKFIKTGTGTSSESDELSSESTD
ncbi:AGAP008193-PA-like protein [Anopheles sinensis]|uniref:AGAP008193-PA-like protein n=1 Tax=Anopheles sinensis TaxID=74873 RepID=A0A084VTD5_ANOSI|nr:AGAP008193-PA-like protein [Anopheles sinensis]